MIDRVTLVYDKGLAQGAFEYLPERQHELENVRYFPKEGRPIMWTAHLGNMFIKSTPKFLMVMGSLSKYLYKDNFHFLYIKGVEKAIEWLSRQLGVPMRFSHVWSLEFGASFSVTHLPSEYYNGLGQLSRYNRLQQPNSIRYELNSRKMALSFYDKVDECKHNGVAIPKDAEGKNIIRYEIKYKSGLSKLLKVPGGVYASMLYETPFYRRLLDIWRDMYHNIQKSPIITLEGINFKCVSDLNTAGILALVQLNGGEAPLIDIIKNEQKAGLLTPQQSYKLKQYVHKTIAQGGALTGGDEFINELDKKIDALYHIQMSKLIE
ncbi:MAG: hypothetical protein LUC91_11215 [Prevotella sp.]|nr:hypothetical protein [Prevotella sp.]